VNNTSPIFTGTLNGKPLRFFPSPCDGPRYVWVLEADLAKALGMTRLQRRILKTMHDEGTMDGGAKLIRTGGSVETIVSYTSARSLINSVEMSNLRARGELEKAAAIYHEKTTTELEAAFIHEMQRAMDVITAEMPAKDSLDYIIACTKAERGDA